MVVATNKGGYFRLESLFNWDSVQKVVDFD